MNKEDQIQLDYEQAKKGKLVNNLNQALSYKVGWLNGFEAGQQAKEEWIRVEDKVPEMIEGKDYSENVIAICDGRRMVMNYARIHSNGKSFYAWCNCYGDIDGDAEFDDEYNPTIWLPIPSLPKE